MTQYLVTVGARRGLAAPQQLYLIDGDLTTYAIQQLTDELLHDPIVQQASWCALDDLTACSMTVGDEAMIVEVAYKAGVTDNEAESVKIGARRLAINGISMVKTLRRYTVAHSDEASQLYNDLVQTAFVYQPASGPSARRHWYALLLELPPEHTARVEHVSLLEASDDELLRISRNGVLSLDVVEMRAIQAYFRQAGREPTDGELETLAQTWSEHCYHKTFKARVRYHADRSPQEPTSALPEGSPYAALQMLQSDHEIDSLIRTFLMAATKAVMQRTAMEQGDDWVLSAFVDNAGIVAFDDDYEVSFKVETHNHPSALEPFGGANTGVGGVVRDVLGVSARPIANTDVLCFGPLDIASAALTPGVLHPRTIAEGVVAGVRDYGNKLGIPTVNGAVLYDPGYIANPLVFCGTVGIAPRNRHPNKVQPGDAIVVVGGRTGRDGIHGATFSSTELTATTAQEVGSAVQIGDPITEKKVLDVILQARDAGWYSAITDCGAGGLSSAVGEMSAHTGATVKLDDVPLKYAGLQPWEIWLSEAQERMVLAVPPAHLAELLALFAGEDVEATVIGHFTDTQRLVVTYGGTALVDLSAQFLHDGIPQRRLEAIWTAPVEQDPDLPVPESLFTVLCSLLSHPNIASKEPIVRTYDHEVGGHTIVKPFTGAECDGPSDAAVLQPLRASPDPESKWRGLALSCGINPYYGKIDPYWMALACVDEAIRNVVAVGGDPNRIAILDNFCWGDPLQPDRMAGLVRATAGCYDAALAYRVPFISGKDSLNNEYRDASGTRHAIPPTLLISALALVPDVRRVVTMDVKEPGNYIYLVGETLAELGGSHYYALHGHIGTSVPRVNLAVAPRIMAAIHRAISNGLVRACHDLSEGGLGVAAAEMAFAGGWGLHLRLRPVPRPPNLERDDILLFTETPSRFLIEVRPSDALTFEAILAHLPFARIGEVAHDAEFIITGIQGDEVLRTGIEQLKAAWQSTSVV